MEYNIQLYKEGKLQKTLTQDVYMLEPDGKMLLLDVSSFYDELRLFDGDHRYIVTYKYITTFQGKAVFKR